MKYTASRIKRFIAQLPTGQMFCSMELVHMGPRYAIDNTTYNLVHRGAIIRLANGVFVRRDRGLKLPSKREVVEYKAKIFAKRIFMHGSVAASKLGLRTEPIKTIVAINGPTSSYRCLGERIHFHGVSQRKVGLEDGPLGRVVRAMWHMGEKKFRAEHFDKAMSVLNYRQKEELRTQARFMPGWLIEYFSWGDPRSLAA